MCALTPHTPRGEVAAALEGYADTLRSVRDTHLAAQEGITAEAARRLKEITKGRFGFVSDFGVVNIASGEVRSPDTLSGGERFQAALSLALAPTSPWFPSRAVQGAWVLFDVLLLFGLRALRAKGRASGPSARRAAWQLSRGLAIAVSADAVLTIVQAVWWNRSVIEGATAWSIVLLACLGPSLASVVLWSATRRMDTLQTSPLSDRR